jgi:hypothetical protein
MNAFHHFNTLQFLSQPSGASNGVALKPKQKLNGCA